MFLPEVVAPHRHADGSLLCAARPFTPQSSHKIQGTQILLAVSHTLHKITADHPRRSLFLSGSP